MTTADLVDLLSLVWILFWISLNAPNAPKNNVLFLMGLVMIIFQIIEYSFAAKIVTEWTFFDTICVKDKGVEVYYHIHYILSLIRTIIGSLILFGLFIACIAAIPSTRRRAL